MSLVEDHFWDQGRVLGLLPNREEPRWEVLRLYENTHTHRSSVQNHSFHQNLIIMNRHQWLKHAMVGTFMLASICCAVLTLQAFYNQSNKKAGIATLHVRIS
jgi:hypothetical protein